MHRPWIKKEHVMDQPSFKIIVGIDFSDASERALMQAVPLAEKLSASVYLVHVAPFQLGVPDALVAPVPRPEDLERCTALLRELRGKLPLSEVHLQVRVGDSLLGLLDAIKEVHPSLVVVGSHGKGMMMRALLGSVSEQLCRRSPVPVLVVPVGQQPPQEHAVPQTEGAAVIARGARSVAVTAQGMAWACNNCGHIRNGRESEGRCAKCGLHPAEWTAASVSHSAVDATEPAVGETVHGEEGDECTSGAGSLFGTSPPGAEGYGSNAELRVRY
jgi:nucleotide-binding universal stress UspA family protein